MKIETKTTLTFKDGTTVNVDEAELRQLFAALKARFETPPSDQSSWRQILEEKERKTRDDDARRFNPVVVPREYWCTPWNQPYWVDVQRTVPPFEITCHSTSQ